MAGDPLLTWGNFKLVGKGPLLAGASHCADLDQPNWMHKTCGGKSGVKYWRTRIHRRFRAAMELPADAEVDR